MADPVPLPSYVPAKYQQMVYDAATATGLDPRVVAAQIEMESGFNPNATSPTGAQGMFQFEPGTYASYGTGSAYNPANEVIAYEKFMSSLLKRYNGDVSKALAAYNAGPGNLGAGAGYAAKILANAKAGASGAKAGTGTGGTSGGATGGAPGTTTEATNAALTTGAGGIEAALNAQAPGTDLGTSVKNLLGLGGNLADLLSGAVALIPHIFAIATDLLKALEWIVNPVSWVRVGAGIAGTLLLLLGLRQVTAAA